MKILVTGGAGYIGSHTCKALAQAGYEPVTYDNLKHGYAHAVKWGPLEQGDILDGARLDEVFAKHQPAAIIHFAGLISVGESVADPGLYLSNNFTGSLSLLDGMRRASVRSIVFSSTAAVYGIPQTVPIAEDAPLQPINPYGVSKLMVEQALEAYSAAYDMSCAALRYFNAAGADPDGEIGENHEPETHAIPLALQAALGKRPSFSLFGDDYPTPDGSAVRDYIHVADLADAHVRAVQKLIAGAPSIALNLGVGRGVSVLEIAAAVERATGRALPLQKAPRRAGDPPSLVADPTLANRILGWTPKYTNINDIVRHAAAWAAR